MQVHKFLVILIAVSLFFGARLPALAAGTDISFTSDTDISLTGPGITLVIASGSLVESYSVSTTALTLNLNSGSNVTVRSDTFNSLSNSLNVAVACSGNSYTYISIPSSSGAQTLVVTPNTESARCGGQTGSFSPTTPLPTTPQTPPPPVTDNKPISTSVGFQNIKLVKEGTTFFVILNGQRFGVPNPGILFTYGLEFKDAAIETSDENSLPYMANLAPADGSLVKSADSPTIWLISSAQKRGFVSATALLDSGYSFSNVLEVPIAQISSLAEASAIVDSSQAHPVGTYINMDGTIFRISSDGMRLGVPNSTVWNSLNKDFDYSKVVTANQADRVLPEGPILTARVY